MKCKLSLLLNARRVSKCENGYIKEARKEDSNI